jgi:hypothetical protein
MFMDRPGRDRMVVGLKLHVQSVPITTNIVSSNPAHDEVYSINVMLYNLPVTCDRSMVFSGYSGFLHL